MAGIKWYPSQSYFIFFIFQQVLTQDTKGKGKAARVMKLTDDEKQKIQEMATPQCMESSERKRQYSAMRRAIAKSCEPALLAKFQLSNDSERCLSLTPSSVSKNNIGSQYNL